MSPWSCGTLSVRRVPVLADVEREERGQERDLIRDELELALRDVELPDRLRLGLGLGSGLGLRLGKTPTCGAPHGTRYVRHARGRYAYSVRTARGASGQAALRL